jgi:N-acetylmuramoyl-L-alanine amidase
MKQPTYMMVHHSAVSHEKNPDQFAANNEYHKAKWNFKSSLGFYLGYNYEINKAGLVRQARADGEPTAACYQSMAYRGVLPRLTGNMNDGRCIHICLDGNFDIEKPAPEQIYALRDLLRKLAKKYGIPKGNVYFHRNYAVKTCPGNNMELDWIRNLIV